VWIIEGSDLQDASEAMKRRQKGDVLTDCLLEDVLTRETLQSAYKAVCRNAGAPGVDGVTTTALADHLRTHWATIRERLLSGTYQPGRILGVKIPKPNGGERQLGIPTTQDRVIQQALVTRLSALLDPTFSERSYGYRQGRSAQDAVLQAQAYVESGKVWVVDLDISAFFDEVNHDILMTRLGTHVHDRRVLKVIGRYLRAELVREGQVEKRDKGTPQGGPLSPLLANLYLDALDKEMEKRELSFVRYADDVAIYVTSERSAKRVLESLTTWIERHLKLRVNREKSGAGLTGKRKLLGFRITVEGDIEVAKESEERHKEAVRSVWSARSGMSGEETLEKWRAYIRGWTNYFGIAVGTLSYLGSLTRRHMRKWFWQRWHGKKGRWNQLKKLGVPERRLKKVNFFCGAWKAARHPAMHEGISNARLKKWKLYTAERSAS
jgi:RNA-directed DNA polymerase